jgi:hypothetical protein
MEHRVAHALQGGAIAIADAPDDPGYPAHRRAKDTPEARACKYDGGVDRGDVRKAAIAEKPWSRSPNGRSAFPTR